MPKQSFSSRCQEFINDFYCIPCSSEVTIPVLTKITEKKVVRIYNIAQMITLILSLYFFIEVSASSLVTWEAALISPAIQGIEQKSETGLKTEQPLIGLSTINK